MGGWLMRGVFGITLGRLLEWSRDTFLFARPLAVVVMGEMAPGSCAQVA